MENEEIIKTFEALGKGSRLQIFQIMVQHSKEGITPTEIIKIMRGIPKNTLSFHLNVLMRANLCFFKKNGKSLIYKPNCCAVKALAHFLLKDCCEKDCQC